MATLLVTIALVVGAVVLVRAQRASLIDNIDEAIEVRADDLELVLASPEPPPTLVVREQEEALVQIIDDAGVVVSATDNVVGLEPVAEPGTDALRTRSDLPIDDEEFRVLTRTIETDQGGFTIIVAGSLEPVQESVGDLRRILILGLPLLLAAMATITWFVVGRALRPVEAIRTEVEGISAASLDRRVPVPATDDEIARLARTMNGMLGRLEDARDRQDRFVADASHELRSPLTSIRSELEIDLEHQDSADWRETHRRVLDDAEDLERLVDDLLFLARNDTGPQGPTERVDIDDIVLAEGEWRRDTADVDMDLSGLSAGQVDGDPNQLRRLVRNLVDNAVRHADRSVAITLHESEGTTKLVVADDGPGIPAGDRERVFDRFTQLDDARTRGRTGSGLGLAIARDIVERHGGTITVGDSDAGGARFEVRLPSQRGGLDRG